MLILLDLWLHLLLFEWYLYICSYLVHYGSSADPFSRPDVRVGDDGDIDDDDDGVDGFERGYTGDHDDDDEYYFYDQHADGSPGVHGSGSRSTHFGGGVDDEARARKDKALMLRERALGELMGREEAVADQIAGYGAGPQELFRQVK